MRWDDFGTGTHKGRDWEGKGADLDGTGRDNNSLSLGVSIFPSPSLVASCYFAIWYFALFAFCCDGLSLLELWRGSASGGCSEWGVGVLRWSWVSSFQRVIGFGFGREGISGVIRSMRFRVVFLSSRTYL